jgi:hypothetical protein
MATAAILMAVATGDFIVNVVPRRWWARSGNCQVRTDGRNYTAPGAHSQQLIQ